MATFFSSKFESSRIDKFSIYLVIECKIALQTVILFEKKLQREERRMRKRERNIGKTYIKKMPSLEAKQICGVLQVHFFFLSKLRFNVDSFNRKTHVAAVGLPLREPYAP